MEVGEVNSVSYVKFSQPLSSTCFVRYDGLYCERGPSLKGFTTGDCVCL